MNQSESSSKLDLFTILQNQYKHLILLITGAPQPNNYHKDYVRTVNKFERLFLGLAATKYSYRHGEPEFREKIDSSIDYLNLFVHFSIITTFLRSMLCLISPADSFIHIYSADYFGHIEHSSVLRLYFITCILVLYTLRQLTRSIESSGVFDDAFRTIINIRKNKSISFTNDFISPHYLKILYFTLTVWNNFVQRATCLFITIIFSLNMMLIYLRIPIFREDSHIFWSTIIWLPSTLLSFINAIAYLSALTGYILTLGCIYALRCKTFSKHYQHLSKICNKQDIKQILNESNNLLLLFLNNLEKFSNGFKWLCFSCFLLLAAITNMTLFASLMITSHSVVLANYFLFLGSPPLIVLLICSHNCAYVIITTRRLHLSLQGILAKGNITFDQRLKIDEIIDRINGSKVAIAVGDMTIVTPLFTLRFLMEFISTFMLQYCNFKSLLT